MKITSLNRSVAINPVGTETTTTVLTVVTSVAHNMVTGDLVSFSPNVKQTYSITKTNATTFTVPAIPTTSGTSLWYVPADFCYPIGLKASAGVSDKFSLASSSESLTTFQAVGKTSAGAGASGTITIEVSNDGVNWVSAGTVPELTLSTTSSSNSLVYNAPWGFVRANVSSITGTDGTVIIYMSRNS